MVAVLHPALAFAIRDIVDQGGIELPEERELAVKHARVRAVVHASAVMSLVVVAAVLVIDVGP